MNPLIDLKSDDYFMGEALRQARHGHTVLGGVEIGIEGDGLGTHSQGNGDGGEEETDLKKGGAKFAELHGSSGVANSVGSEAR